MKRDRNEGIWDFENGMPPQDGGQDLILGLDGGTTSTVCICMPVFSFTDNSLPPDPPPVLAHAVAGCSNHNSVGETAAKETLERVMADALFKAGSTRSAVRAVCLAVSGVNHPTDQQRILSWLRSAVYKQFCTYYNLIFSDIQYFCYSRAMFPNDVKCFVHNDAVAAMASGTMGKLHGCVLIAGTGTIAYGYTEDGREARASGAGPVLGDWGSGYGIAAMALTSVIRAYDGRGPQTMLTSRILHELELSSPDELIGWTYADPSWARIAALVPVVVSCAEAGDEVANGILLDAVQELASSIKAVVCRLGLCGEDGKGSCPLVMVGGVLQANKKWDIGKEVISCISKEFPGMLPIRPKVEPAVGAALLAWNVLKKQSQSGG
ncbi:putative hexokinase [Helianthus annuus]|nr:putative hexokinase [Helianthus annuus]